jgi:hypothetical protein
MGGAYTINEDFTGYAQGNTEMMEMLSKALTAGTGVDAGSFTGGRALTPESLDFTLVNVLHNQDEARLFQRLKKKPVKSVVHQWNKRTEVGADDGAWVAEGGTSQDTDQTIGRLYKAAKFLQTRRQVTLQAAMSDMVENAVALEKNAGTLWIIRNTEKGLIYGNSSFVAEQPDGLLKQIPSTNVLDMRGAYANSATFEAKMTEGCRVIRDNYGKASLFLASTKVIEDVQALIKDRIRFNNPQGNGVPAGDYPTNYPTPFGKPELLDDIFIKEGTTPSASSITASRPSAPTLGATTEDTDVSGSEFAAADAGTYVYKVVAVNKYGDSVASAEVVSGSVVAGGSITFAITEGGGDDTTAYKIYRSKVAGEAGETDLRYMTTVAYSASPQNFVDKNEDLPGCSDAFLLTMDPMYDAIEYFQFLPLMKFDLYPTNAAVIPFLMLLFGNLALKKDVQHVRIKNICPSTGGFF